LCGVGVRRGDDWAGVVLIAPESGIPRGHPLGSGGLGKNTAGIVLVYIDSEAAGVPMGKKLCVGLCRRLRGGLAGIEAQAGSSEFPASALAPSVKWLEAMGFQRLRYPPRRYRLDLSATASWVQKLLRWYRRPALKLSPQSGSARRTG
ncbi:MAG: hypothetical protein FWD55_07760, partial [Propionibacteriaceae bacterium]|nr:hypothetical protein [Propionibacteriaceae bacterium]